MSREAMKQALEAFDALYMNDYSGYEISKHESYIIDDAVKALRQALETEQEPVAWMHNFITGNVITHIPADIGRHPERWTPLYTSPPKREWVGLTDGEIVAATNAVHGFGAIKQRDMNFARAIEAKLKEKNT